LQKDSIILLSHGRQTATKLSKEGDIFAEQTNMF
jgi:hypothetical protein